MNLIAFLCCSAIYLHHTHWHNKYVHFFQTATRATDFAHSAGYIVHLMVETGIICWLATGLIAQVTEDSNTVFNFGMCFTVLYFSCEGSHRMHKLTIINIQFNFIPTIKQYKSYLLSQNHLSRYIFKTL